MRKFILLSLFVILSLGANAYDFCVDGIYYDQNSNGYEAIVTYKTKSNSGYSHLDSVVIPSSVVYKGTIYAVTYIGSKAFSGCTRLTSVAIPNSVKYIEYYAFKGCTKLTSVNIPDNVRSVYTGAFPNNTNIFVKKGTYTLLALWGGDLSHSKLGHKTGCLHLPLQLRQHRLQLQHV